MILTEKLGDYKVAHVIVLPPPKLATLKPTVPAIYHHFLPLILAGTL